TDVLGAVAQSGRYVCAQLPREVPVLMPRVLALLWVVAVCGGVARPAAAQPPSGVTAWLGQRVTATQIEVEGRPETDPALLALLEVHVGGPLRFELVRESVAHLFNLGR